MRQARILLMAGILILGASFAPGASASVWETPGKCAEEMSLNDFLLIGDDRAGGPPGKRHNKADDDFFRHFEKKIGKLPPGQQEEARRELEQMKQKRDSLRSELSALPPEERKARMEELKQEFKSSREEYRAAFRRKFQERWDSASEEERKEFCGNARERCAEGGRKACDFAEKACESY